MDHLPATMESGFPMYEEECEEPFDQEPEIETSSCLGALLNGGANCTPNFVPGTIR